MSNFQNYEKGTNLIDLHSACRMGSLDDIQLAFKLDPDKLNSKDAGVRVM